jgi:hypothetical protein
MVFKAICPQAITYGTNVVRERHKDQGLGHLNLEALKLEDKEQRVAHFHC